MGAHQGEGVAASTTHAMGAKGEGVPAQPQSLVWVHTKVKVWLHRQKLWCGTQSEGVTAQPQPTLSVHRANKWMCDTNHEMDRRDLRFESRDDKEWGHVTRTRQPQVALAC